MVAVLGISFTACSESDDLDDVHYGNGMDGSTLNVRLSSAGTLPSYISDSTMYKITSLKVSGEINGTDIRLLRQMAGSDEKGNTTRGVLAYLDLSDAKIVSGGDSYYYSSITENGKLPHRMFVNCKALTSLKFPVFNDGDQFSSRGQYAAEDCTGLVSAVFPEGTPFIPHGCFIGCSSLTSIDIPSSVTSIKETAFKGCSSLTSIDIPSSVTRIEERAFKDCSNLTSVELPNSVTSIAYHAFEGCSSLTNINLPSSITSIGNGTFYCCSCLTSIDIPSSVTTIENSTFFNCYKLGNVKIPNSVTRIGDAAFYCCFSLTSIDLPSSITSIGTGAFNGCWYLKKVTCRSTTPPTISKTTFSGDYAFYEGTYKGTLYVPKGSKEKYANAHEWCLFANIVEMD